MNPWQLSSLAYLGYFFFFSSVVLSDQKMHVVFNSTAQQCSNVALNSTAFKQHYIWPRLSGSHGFVAHVVSWFRSQPSNRQTKHRHLLKPYWERKTQAIGVLSFQAPWSHRMNLAQTCGNAQKVASQCSSLPKLLLPGNLCILCLHTNNNYT